jgi:hypothetical protein
LLTGTGHVDFRIEVSESGSLDKLDYTIDLISLGENNS